jgi:hypothetical protein
VVKFINYKPCDLAKPWQRTYEKGLAMANSSFIAPDPILLSIGRTYLGKSLKVPRIRGNELTGMAIADEFAIGQHNPDDHQTFKAYLAFVDETTQQFKFLVDQGYTFLPWLHEGQPYGDSPAMFRDAREHKRLYVYMTKSGFGHEDDGLDQSRNPLMQPSEFQGWYNNDLFRAVHDILGHAMMGHSFAPQGELMAWRTHWEFYSHEARRAMTTETLGQNSWNNYQVDLRTPEGSLIPENAPGWIAPKNRRYAPQKMMLLPNWMERIYLEP